MSDTAYVSRLPGCDIHGGDHDACYDLNLAVIGQRGWANVCEGVYVEAGSPALGTGRGQRLVVGEAPERTDDDIRKDVAAAVDAGDFDALEDIVGDRDFAEFI